MKTGKEKRQLGVIAPVMCQGEIESFDGRWLKVIYTDPDPRLPSLLVALPFGIKASIAIDLYVSLAPNFNVITWESRYVLDLDKDADDDDIEALDHAYDLISVAEYHRQQIQSKPQGSDRRKIHLLGYCSGAGISMLSASMRPKIFQTVSLVSGEYLWPNRYCKKTRFQKEVDTLLGLAATNMATAKQLYEVIKKSNSSPQSEFHEIVSLPFSDPAYLHRYGRNYMAYKKLDLFEAARKVSQPTLIMASHQDRQVDVSSSEFLVSLIQNATAKWATYGDHYELCRANSFFVSSVKKFVEVSQRQPLQHGA